MLPKFISLEVAYLLLMGSKEVCSMIYFSNIFVDEIRVKFILFSLKHATKKWMCGLTTNPVSTWDDFVKLFLRK